MENEYLILKKKQEKIINNFPQFFAFSDEQLKEGLIKLNVTEKNILSTGFGGFIKISDKNKYKEMWEIINKQIEEAIKNKIYLFKAFVYEMGNHEYCYSQEDEEVLSAVGINRELKEEEKVVYEKAKEKYFSSVVM